MTTTLTSRLSPRRSPRVMLIVTKGHWGGAQRYVWELSHSLSLQGFSILVVAGSQGLLTEKLQQEGIKSILVPGLHNNSNPLSAISALRLLIKSIKTERPDTVHLNSTKAGLLGALAATLCNVPRTVFTAHGWPFHERRDIFSKTLLFLASALTTHLSHQTIVICKRDYRASKVFPFLRREKVTLIRNGVEQPRLMPRTSARNVLSSLCSRELVDENIWIGSIGELNDNKNHRLLINAIHDLQRKDIYTVIIGGGANYAALQDQIRQLGLQDQIFLTNHVLEANRLLLALDVFVLPSLKEGLPYALLEAAHAGLPTLAADVGGVSEVIRHRETGLLFQAGEKISLVRQLRNILDSETTRASLGRHLGQSVQSGYSVDAMIDKIARLYCV